MAGKNRLLSDHPQEPTALRLSVQSLGGSRLLQAVEPVIEEKECCCVPHRYLRSFYGRIGFVEIEATKAPPFLHKRCAEFVCDLGVGDERVR